MIARIQAPWSENQVKNLNKYQSNGRFHPFTCGRDHEGDKVLRAEPLGWKCSGCDYTQDWAYTFMAEGIIDE